MQRRQEQARHRKRKPGGRPPKPPQPGVRDKDQYNFTDPDSRIMKNSTDQGVDQHYNARIAVTQDSLFIVAQSLSNQPNDQHESEPTVDALPLAVGHPKAAAIDNGYFSGVSRILREPCVQVGAERAKTRLRSKSKLARPYIERLMNFSRLTCLSV